MASENTIILYLFIQITLNLVTIDCARLNTLKVLLPIFNDFSTNFTLEADEGCYRWSTTRLDIIQITPIIDYNKNSYCSNKAIVSSITKERTRNNALVIADNVYTKQYLRCNVIVDVIHALKIITRTRELLLEEDPVKLEVRAYDNLGNEFSNLLGVEFSWNLKSFGPNQNFTVLHFVKFDDSPFENPPVIHAMEADNKRGNIALIKGLRTGSAKISVNLSHEEYGKVVTDEVQFSVIANFILMPPEVYIMMGDIISIKVFYLTYGDMEEMILPNKQYYLKTESTDIAVVDQESSKVTGTDLGETRVVLYNRNVVEADSNMKMPAATIHVVEADYIRLSELPYKNWAKFLYKPRDIITAVFTKRPHKFIDDSPEVEQSEVEAQKGNYSTLRCAVRGNQTSRITNQKNNASNVETEPRYRVFIDGTLQIISLYKTYSSIYLCTVDNKVGRPLGKEINLKIRALVTAAIKVGSGVFQVGGNIDISCDVDGHPKPEVQWFKDNDDALVPSEKIQIESYRLIIHQANEADSGTYKCEAYNGYSKSYSSSSIRVDDVYIIDQQVYLNKKYLLLKH